MKRPVLALVFAGMLLVATAPGAFATTTKVASTGAEVMTDVTYPGVESLVGTLYSLIGMEDTADLYDSGGHVVAVQTSVVNYSIDVVSGLGELWGTSQQFVPPPAGQDPTILIYTCTWHGTFVPGMTSYTGPGWVGKSVCHGVGPMTGWQTRADVTSATDWAGTTYSTITFFPGDRASG